jgi:hypothetical protein
MRPRGFGKNYFRLSAILAYSVMPKLQSQVSSAQEHFFAKLSSDAQEEESPPDELLTTTLLQSDKPCHCNCFFKIRIRLILLLNHFIPRCPYYTVCFAFRRSGVHPPLSF